MRESATFATCASMYSGPHGFCTYTTGGAVDTGAPPPPWSAERNAYTAFCPPIGFTAIATGVFALLPLPLPVLTTGLMAGCVVMLGLVLYGAGVGARAAADASRGSDD
jgi:hypothetical protein